MSKKLKILISILLIVGVTFFIMSCAVKDPLGPFKPEGGSSDSGGSGSGSGGSGSGSGGSGGGSGGSGGGGGGITYLFDWEDNTTQGWFPDSYTTDQAFFVPPAPEASTEKHYSGNASLKCHVVLTQGHANYDKGNIWVACPPEKKNLNGKKVSVYVWVPQELVNLTAPNGVTLVFKDLSSDWKWGQCQWNNIMVGGQWVKYSSIIPDDLDMVNTTSGFDPTQIRLLGIKLGCGSGNGTRFNGYIYIDAYNIE